MIIRTELEKYLKNSNIEEFNYGDNNLYIVKEITKDLVCVYHTDNLMFGDLTNVGIYDRRRNGFALQNIYSNHQFKQLGKLYKDEYFDRYDLLSELKKHVRTELNSFYETNKFKRSIDNDLNNISYANKVNEEASRHCKSGTLPKFNGFDYEEINNIKLTDELVLKMLEDIYDVAYEEAEKILENNEQKIYEYFFVKDVCEKIEEFKNDKNNPLSAVAKINELSNSEKYASYNVNFKWYQGKENVNIKVKKADINNIPLFMVNSISWRSTVLFDASEYGIEDYTQLTMDDWVTKVANNIEPCYYGNNDLYIFNFLPKTVLSNPDFWLESKVNTSANMTYIDKTLLNDYDFVKKLTEQKKNLRNIRNLLNPTIANDPQICVNLLDNTASFDIGYIFGEDVVKNKDFQLKYIDIIKNTRDLSMMDKYFDYSDDDIMNNLEKAILNITDEAQKTIPSWRKPTVNTDFMGKVNDVNVVKKLINIEGIDIQTFVNLKSELINDKSLLDLLFANKSNLRNGEKMDYTQSFADNFVILYNKLDQDIINDDYYFAKLIITFSTSDKIIEGIIDKTIGKKEFNNRPKIHDVLLNDSRIFYNVILTSAMTKKIEECLSNKEPLERALFGYYVERSDRDINTVIKALENDFNMRVYDIKDADRETWETLFKKDKKYVAMVPRYLYAQKDDLARLAANYDSIIEYICNIKTRWGKNFLINDPEFVIKSLKHNFNDVVKIEKPYKSKDNYSILNEKSFISRLIKEFPDKMDILVEYLVNEKFDIISDEEVIKEFLLHDFKLIYHFNRKVYNNKELILDVMNNSTQSKDYIVDKLKTVGSKLVKEKEFK